MRKNQLIFAMILLCIVCILLSSCAGSGIGNTPGLRGDNTTEQASRETLREEPPTPAVDPDFLEAANAALFREFPALKSAGLESFRITQQSYGGDDGKYGIGYRLVLCGMVTIEDYKVDLLRTENGIEILECRGYHSGEYLKFLTECTPERVEAAKKKIEAQAGESTDSGALSLYIDDKGALVLNLELIVDTPFGDGCCVDHDHKFYSEVICG